MVWCESNEIRVHYLFITHRTCFYFRTLLALPTSTLHRHLHKYDDYDFDQNRFDANTLCDRTSFRNRYLTF